MHVSISLPSGQHLLSDSLIRDVSILVNDIDFPADFLVLDLTDFDVILGIDWLTTYSAKWDFHAEKISLKSRSEQKTSFHKQPQLPTTRVVTAC